mmetsp:Transcript_4598/g.6747  ORF Transcript_4598/g.6747 Transcript_4598/m.6747 type:complete len:211 (-) Transcript_4598:124-756(-)
MVLHTALTATSTAARRYTASCIHKLPLSSRVILCPSSSTAHLSSNGDSVRQRQFHTTKYSATASPSPSTSASASPKVEQIFQKILQLDTIEVHLLTELVNEKLGTRGLSMAEQMAMEEGGGGGGRGTDGGADQAQEKEEKTAFDLKLTAFDAKSKIKVIKEIRSVTGLGLKEAKELVEGAPKVVKKDLKMEEAEEIKAKIEAVGGTVEIS